MSIDLLGRKLQDLFPIAFLPNNHALAVAIMSYNGGIDYGLLGDYDALADIDVIAEGIEQELAELLAAARSRGAGRQAHERTEIGTQTANGNATGNGGQPRIVPTSSSRPQRGPAADMREQVQHTVARILELRPRRVLEIGCGTGLLLFRLAPHCRTYWATDF